MAPVAVKNNANKTTEKEGISSTSKNISKHQTGSSLPYALFMYRQAVKKRSPSFLEIAHTKYQLTDELIKETVKNIHKCSADDLKIVSRETLFKKNLTRQMGRARFWQMSQEKQYRKKEYEKVQQHLRQKQQQNNQQQLVSIQEQKQKQQQQNCQQQQCNFKGRGPSNTKLMQTRRKLF